MTSKILGHYQITSQIGKGGMGEVYRARNTKLGREVAIKVFSEEFARHAERMARSQRAGDSISGAVQNSGSQKKSAEMQDK